MSSKRQTAAFVGIFSVLVLSLWLLFSQSGREALPPEFVLYVKEPKPASEGSPPVGNWANLSGVTAIGDRLFLLDTGNDRVVEVDRNGQVVSVLCEIGDCRFLLKDPQSMTAHDGELYIANTGARQIVVLSAEGSVARSLDLSVPGSPGTERLVPSGIAVSPAGEIYVADSSRDLVLKIDKDAGSASVFLDSVADGDKYRASKPAGLAVDRWGNVYVANSASGRIRKYSSEGRHLQEFSMRSNPEFFSPSYLAVDVQGNVYFTDNRRRMVYVYDQGGAIVGVVGLLDASRVDSPGVLRDPRGLHMEGDTLYVADREAGLFGFRIEPDYWRTGRSASDWVHR